MRTVKTILATVAAIGLLAGNAWATDLTNAVQQTPAAQGKKGKSKKMQAAVHGGKLIKAKEQKAGRKAMLIGLSSTQESALLLSYHNQGGRDDLEVWRYVFGSSKKGEVQKNHVRKARKSVQNKVLTEMTAELNKAFRLQNGQFAASDFQKVVRTRNKAGKMLTALKFVQTSQRGNKKTQRVGYAYASKSAQGKWATKVVDYNPRTHRRESRFGAAKFRIKTFSRRAPRRAPGRSIAAH
jgi:hypothetical protein